MSVQYSGDKITFADGSTVASGWTWRNRIINGAMVIDQRNAVAALTVNSGAQQYAVDRFVAQGQVTDGVFTVQQSSVAPTGFSNSLLATVTTADASIGAAQFYWLTHRIEGYNVSDFGFGAVGASTVTLSFWVRSSLTGTFGGSLTNDAADRSYPFSYTISSANTWEQKTITIAGDTTGTWLKTNGIGCRIYWNIGAGSNYTASAGAWVAQTATSVTGSTNLIGTNGATFYITGVQLEKGSTATSFDYRPYGTELALCQRYYVRISGGDADHLGFGQVGAATTAFFWYPFQMRSNPTAGYSSISINDVSVSPAVTSITYSGIVQTGVQLSLVASGGGMTAGRSARLRCGTAGYIDFSAEL